MGTAESEELREELRLVEEDLSQLRQTTADLRQRMGERWDSPGDDMDRTVLITQVQEQEELIEDLESRRELLRQRLREI